MKIIWEKIKQFEDIKYEKGLNEAEGINKITINRPVVRNAFRPQTVFELKEAFTLAREDQTCGVIILTGEGELAFCSGGDQTIRGDAGYVGEFSCQTIKHSIQSLRLISTSNNIYHYLIGICSNTNHYNPQKTSMFTNIIRLYSTG